MLKNRGFSSSASARFGIIATVLMLSGCGGSGSDTEGATAKVVTATTALKTGSVEFAQTHIMPAAGLSWDLPNDKGTLTLVAKRDTLAMMTLDVSDAVNPVINAAADGKTLGKVALNLPSALPVTEGGGAPYKAGLYSAVIPAAWMVKGVSLTISADNYLPSAATAPVVGAATTMELNVIPFYLFGANDANSEPLSKVQAPTAAIQNDIYDKWPISQLAVKPFSGGRVSFPSLVVSPRGDRNGVRQPAYLLSNMDQQKDGYAAMSAVLSMMGLLRAANGEEATNNLYYGPMVTLNAAGRQVGLGGGLGGGGGGVGDTAYSGVFIHEMGHAYGLPHANDGHTGGRYPYVGGSTKGSAWGYDQIAKRFLNLLIDKSSGAFNNCTANRQTTTDGKCYKQDPMQGGHEDRSAGHTYGTFSDYNAGKLQQWFEGRATADAAGKISYSGGVIFTDASVASGYARWNSIDRAFVEHVPTVVQGGLYGINNNLPVTKDVPVNTIVISHSNAGSPGASMIYTPIRHTGNLIRTFDPTSAQDRADITINTAKYHWYCVGTGCDYTLRVTYADGSVLHRVLKGSFRSWFKPTVAFPAEASDALAGASFRTWAINVPGDKAIRKVEMLDTPMVWQAMPANPAVVISYTAP